MAFGGSRFGASVFAGANHGAITPHPGGGYILDRPQYGGYTADRPTATTGYASDRPRTGGHISDRGATP